MIQKWSAADGKSSCQHYCGTYNSVRRGDRLVHLKLSFVLEGRFFLSSINTPHIQPPPSRLQAGGRQCVPRVHATRTALYTTSLPPLQTTLTEQRGGERECFPLFLLASCFLEKTFFSRKQVFGEKKTRDGLEKRLAQQQ